MLVFPNCKINLGLNIIRKREDEFHDLETIFFPIAFTDILEIITSEHTGVLHLGGVGHLYVTGLPVEKDENNLCVKAYNLLKKDFPHLPLIKIHLHKVIPTGAGLGGGSGDAAFMLKLLNEKYKLKLSDSQLINYASQLGSDCPFFLINKPCYATGRGEKLEAINIDLKNYKILIINPAIHIDTKWAFSRIVPRQRKISVKEIIAQPIETWKEQLQNDFETPVFKSYPEIKKIKEDMYSLGSEYASLSGSGSTVFGIFRKDQPIQIEKTDKYFYKTIDI